MVVIADKAGGLGNRLLIFAHFIASGIENGYQTANPSFDEYAQYFPSLRHDILTRYPSEKTPFGRNGAARRLAYIATFLIAAILFRLPRLSARVVRLIPGQRMDLSDPRIADNARTKTLFVQGWLFRDTRSLRKHASAVRKVFRPDPAIEMFTSEVVEVARRDCDVLVGVHVRQTDYRVHLGGRFFFEIPVYAEFMRRTAELFPARRVGFLVASDEKLELGMFGALDVRLAPGAAIEDLYCLAGCDYLLGPPSSFSLWSSFFGEVPMYMIVDQDARFALSDFRVAPDFSNPQIEALYI